MAFDAIVLAGGRGSRLGGADKALLEVGSTTTLAAVLRAVADADRVVVAGPERDGYAVPFVQESPPEGGPVAGIAAALPRVEADLVAVLACDLPFVTADLVQGLVAAVRADGVVLVDAEGRRQWLCAVYRTASLRRSVDALGAGRDASMRALVAGLELAELPDPQGRGFDVDSPADLASARNRT